MKTGPGKVKAILNEEIKSKILEKIKAYDKIIISRHVRPDGDASGSTLGLQKLLRNTYPEKTVLVVNDDYGDAVSFLGEEDREVPDEAFTDALLLAIDTATLDRLSNSRYKLAKELIKIDHHVEVEPYGDLSWVEDKRSSACEMIVDFYNTFKSELKLDKEAALCLYTGMITDSGRFRFRETNGETLRLASILLDMGLDTESLFAQLYLEDYDYLKFKAYVFKKMKMTENGVAYLVVDKKMQDTYKLSHEQAGNTVSMMSEIKGTIIWIVFIETEENTYRVRLRSRFVAINKLAEKYDGGGHLCACGATVHSKKDLKKLLADADALSKDFKANNFYI